jgi:hypothetical protein
MKYLSNNIHYFQKAKVDVKTHQKCEHLVLRWSKVLDGLCQEKTTLSLNIKIKEIQGHSVYYSLLMVS